MIAWVWLGVFAWYAVTASPAVTVGDSGELISAAYTVGVAHPPGYPLYVVLAKGFSALMPLGNIAFRINVWSSVCGALACAGMAGWLNSLLKGHARMGRVAAVGCGVAALAVGHTVWQHGVIAEVYALTLALLVGTLWVTWKSQGCWSWNYAAWCGVGLSLMHHQSMALALPALFVAGGSAWGRPGWRKGGSTGLLLVGLMGTLFLLLPLRSLANPGLDWGNPETLKNLLHTVLREQYKVTTGSPRDLALWWGQVIVWFSWHLSSWGIPLVGFSVTGWLWAVWQAWKVRQIDASRVTSHAVVLLVWLGIGFGVCAVGNFKLEAFDREVIEVFWMPCAIAVAWGVAWGVMACWEKRGRILLVGVVTALVWQGRSSADALKHLREPIGYWHGENILSVPERASWLFVAAEDNDIFPVAYGVLVEGRGHAHRVLDDLGCVITRAYGDDFKWLDKPRQLLRMKAIQERIVEEGSDPEYFTLAAHLWNVVLESPTKDCVPAGLLYRVVDHQKGWGGAEATEGEMAQRLLETRRFAAIAWKRNPLVTEERVETIVGWDVFSRTVAARYAYMMAEHELAGGRTSAALRWGAKAGLLGHDISWMQNSLGNVFARNGLRGFAMAAYERVMKLEPQRPEPFLNAGGILLGENRLDEAIALFTEAIKRNGSFIPAYINLGTAYSRKGDVETAKKVWRRGLELDPQNVPLRLNLDRAE